MNTLIIGRGEVGEALKKVLDTRYEVGICDKEGIEGFLEVDIIHICFPYSKNFVKQVKEYKKQYTPRYTVIHSTVPVGTSKLCGATHSPIRGIHPDISGDLTIFDKFVGGQDADVVAEYFRRAGMQVQICRKSETTELAKILSTTRYGWDITFAKETETLCNKYSVPFSEVYTLWTQSYNEGFRKKGILHFIRPIIQPIQTAIGGHCVMPNIKLLKSKLTDFLKK